MAREPPDPTEEFWHEPRPMSREFTFSGSALTVVPVDFEYEVG